jgi:hypothetical protein
METGFKRFSDLLPRRRETARESLIVGGESDPAVASRKLQSLFEKWKADGTDDLAVWPALREGIEQHRLSERRRFRDG